MPILGYIVTILVGYLLGSIPTGFVVAKTRGVDIRTVGSGNIGATNVFRALGVPAGVFVLLADAAKGWLAVVVVAKLAGTGFWGNVDPLNSEWLAICGGVAAIVGHNYSCWLHFKGGKGIATSAGVLTALVPWALLIILAVFIIVLALSRYVSLASIAASSTLPFATWLTVRGVTRVSLTAVTGAMAALAIYKHKGNIKRLLNGTEHRLGAGKTPPPGAPDTPP
jgi:glycerol-3-phosphate acyltransferase PlsY